MRKSRIHLFWNNGVPATRFRTCVSLHSHTMRSREKLTAIPRFAACLPGGGTLLAFHQRRYRMRHGREMDFTQAYWTPPPPEREALRIEATQAERTLGMDSLVSLTDHDTIDAPLHLRVLDEGRGLPISMEWSVPIGSTTIHLGVHSLPPDDPQLWVEGMAEYTRDPRPALLADLLAALDDNPGILTVLNHPACDELGVGGPRHLAEVRRFLDGYGRWIHAVEVNGMRPWCENLKAMHLAQELSLPLVSGGDRHGCEPSTAVNLTNAGSFTEFVSEVRDDKISDILLMPQYREPHLLRCLETMWDVLRDHPEYAGRTRWSDRFFFITREEHHLPLSSVWKGNESLALNCLIASIRLFGNDRVRSTLRSALSANEVSL